MREQGPGSRPVAGITDGPSKKSLVSDAMARGLLPPAVRERGPGSQPLAGMAQESNIQKIDRADESKIQNIGMADSSDEEDAAHQHPDRRFTSPLGECIFPGCGDPSAHAPGGSVLCTHPDFEAQTALALEELIQNYDNSDEETILMSHPNVNNQNDAIVLSANDPINRNAAETSFDYPYFENFDINARASSNTGEECREVNITTIGAHGSAVSSTTLTPALDPDTSQNRLVAHYPSTLIPEGGNKLIGDPGTTITTDDRAKNETMPDEETGNDRALRDFHERGVDVGGDNRNTMKEEIEGISSDSSNDLPSPRGQTIERPGGHSIVMAQRFLKGGLSVYSPVHHARLDEKFKKEEYDVGEDDDFMTAEEGDPDPDVLRPSLQGEGTQTCTSVLSPESGTARYPHPQEPTSQSPANRASAFVRSISAATGSQYLSLLFVNHSTGTKLRRTIQMSESKMFCETGAYVLRNLRHKKGEPQEIGTIGSGEEDFGIITRWCPGIACTRGLSVSEVVQEAGTTTFQVMLLAPENIHKCFYTGIPTTTPLSWRPKPIRDFAVKGKRSDSTMLHFHHALRGTAVSFWVGAENRVDETLAEVQRRMRSNETLHLVIGGPANKPYKFEDTKFKIIWSKYRQELFWVTPEPIELGSGPNSEEEDQTVVRFYIEAFSMNYDHGCSRSETLGKALQRLSEVTQFDLAKTKAYHKQHVVHDNTKIRVVVNKMGGYLQLKMGNDGERNEPTIGGPSSSSGLARNPSLGGVDAPLRAPLSPFLVEGTTSTPSLQVAGRKKNRAGSSSIAPRSLSFQVSNEADNTEEWWDSDGPPDHQGWRKYFRGEVKIRMFDGRPGESNLVLGRTLHKAHFILHWQGMRMMISTRSDTAPDRILQSAEAHGRFLHILRPGTALEPIDPAGAWKKTSTHLLEEVGFCLHIRSSPQPGAEQDGRPIASPRVPGELPGGTSNIQILVTTIGHNKNTKSIHFDKNQKIGNIYPEIIDVPIAARTVFFWRDQENLGNANTRLGDLASPDMKIFLSVSTRVPTSGPSVHIAKIPPNWATAGFNGFLFEMEFQCTKCGKVTNASEVFACLGCNGMVQEAGDFGDWILPPLVDDGQLVPIQIYNTKKERTKIVLTEKRTPVGEVIRSTRSGLPPARYPNPLFWTDHPYSDRSGEELVIEDTRSVFEVTEGGSAKLAIGSTKPQNILPATRNGSLAIAADLPFTTTLWFGREDQPEIPVLARLGDDVTEVIFRAADYLGIPTDRIFRAATQSTTRTGIIMFYTDGPFPVARFVAHYERHILIIDLEELSRSGHKKEQEWAASQVKTSNANNSSLSSPARKVGRRTYNAMLRIRIQGIRDIQEFESQENLKIRDILGKISVEYGIPRQYLVASQQGIGIEENVLIDNILEDEAQTIDVRNSLYRFLAERAISPMVTLHSVTISLFSLLNQQHVLIALPSHHLWYWVLEAALRATVLMPAKATVKDWSLSNLSLIFLKANEAGVTEGRDWKLGDQTMGTGVDMNKPISSIISRGSAAVGLIYSGSCGTIEGLDGQTSESGESGEEPSENPGQSAVEEISRSNLFPNGVHDAMMNDNEEIGSISGDNISQISDYDDFDEFDGLFVCEAPM